MRIKIASGTTLIELLISSTLVATLIVGVVSTASTSFAIRNRIRAALTVNENLQYALGRISGSLIEAAGIITIVQGTSTASPLTSREIEVTNLNLTRVSSTTPGVRIVATARLRDSAEAQLTVTTTILLRQ